MQNTCMDFNRPRQNHLEQYWSYSSLQISSKSGSGQPCQPFYKVAFWSGNSDKGDGGFGFGKKFNISSQNYKVI